MPNLAENAAKLLAEFESLAPWHPGKHVLQRIAALMGGDGLLYIDHSMVKTDAGLHGRIVVYTTAKVIVADVTAPESPGPVAVSVRGWARTTLVEAGIPEADGLHQSANSNSGWQDVPEAGWPDQGVVLLAYANGEKLKAPMRPLGTKALRAEFAVAVAELLQDLARS